MSIGNEVKTTAIQSLVTTLGFGHAFTRVVAEIERVNTSMPNATGAEKRDKIIADAKIIFVDVIEPVAGAVLNLLIELGVAYVTLKVPFVAPIAIAAGSALEQDITQKVTVAG